MPANTQTKLSITDLFGNVFPVTDLNAAIAERKMCVDARVDVIIEPFKYEEGIKVMIPERAGEEVTMASYHDDLLVKLLELQAQQAS